MNCSKCNSEAIFKQGTKKETGKPWSGYFCQNPDCKNVDWTPKASSKPQNGGKVNISDRDPMAIIGDELASINKRLDELGTYLKSKFN